MRDDYTHIVAILDASGSMSDLTDDTIGGVNGFLKEQKKVKGKATVTLVQFNTEVSHVYENVNLKNIKPLTRRSYNPGGGTALLKAVADTIDETGRYLAGLPEGQRPAKVVVLIVTDGQENSSPAWYSKANVSHVINHQRDVYKWEFVFLGANQDAIQEGRSLGIPISNSMNYNATHNGIDVLYKTLSDKVMFTRSCSGSALNTMSFTQEERDLATSTT